VFFATEPFLDLFDNTIADLKYLRKQVRHSLSRSRCRRGRYCGAAYAHRRAWLWACVDGRVCVRACVCVCVQVEVKIDKSLEDCAKEEDTYKSKIWDLNRTYQVCTHTRAKDEQACVQGII
jgi:hypothetical protein